MKGRGLPVAVASLVLAATVAVPALSVAQQPLEPGAPAASDQTSTTPTPPAPPPAPAEPGGSGSSGGGSPSQGSGEPASTPSPQAAELAGTQKRKNTDIAEKSSSVTVSMEDFFFSPTSVKVGVGDSVTWVNNGQEPHSATANDGSFDTGIFNGGGSRSVSFSNAGSFAYICTVHPNMTGTVTVSSSGGGGGNGGGSEAAAVGSSGAAASGSSLASTGSDLPAVFAIGLVLLLCGAVLRRHTPSA